MSGVGDANPGSGASTGIGPKGSGPGFGRCDLHPDNVIYIKPAYLPSSQCINQGWGDRGWGCLCGDGVSGVGAVCPGSGASTGIGPRGSGPGFGRCTIHCSQPRSQPPSPPAPTPNAKSSPGVTSGTVAPAQVLLLFLPFLLHLLAYRT